MTDAGIPFVKGHGTGNDFVILSDLADLDDRIDLTATRVSALCDRHRGIGADGVLVVARTENRAEVADQAQVARFFMDYRNADGSVAQMCGNGARVFVAHLLVRGLIDAEDGWIATRGGPRPIRVDPRDATITIDMGPAEILDRGDIEVSIGDPAGPARAAAIGVLMPNPHAVTWVADLADAGPLTAAPLVAPASAYPEGVNVEYVRVLADDHLAMRVFERGVGETLSCGTGACAAAVATLRRAGATPADQRIRVDVPGGSLTVRWRADGNVELSGPVAMVARGTIDRAWWEGHD